MKSDDTPYSEKRWAVALAEISDIVFRALLSADLDEEQADKYSRVALNALTDAYGGSPLYIPKQDSMRRWWRDCEIYRQAGRVPFRQLAQEHGLSEMRIRQIQQAQAELRRQERQAEKDGLS